MSLDEGVKEFYYAEETGRRDIILTKFVCLEEFVIGDQKSYNALNNNFDSLMEHIVEQEGICDPEEKKVLKLDVEYEVITYFLDHFKSLMRDQQNYFYFRIPTELGEYEYNGEPIYFDNGEPIMDDMVPFAILIEKNEMYDPGEGFLDDEMWPGLPIGAPIKPVDTFTIGEFNDKHLSFFYHNTFKEWKPQSVYE